MMNKMNNDSINAQPDVCDPAVEIAASNARAFFNASHQTLANLYGRWLDESEYEDIADYAKPFERIATAHGVTIVRMTKRPFGLVFTVGKSEYAMTANSRTVQYKRIK